MGWLALVLTLRRVYLQRRDPRFAVCLPIHPTYTRFTRTTRAVSASISRNRKRIPVRSSILHTKAIGALQFVATVGKKRSAERIQTKDLPVPIAQNTKQRKKEQKALRSQRRWFRIVFHACLFSRDPFLSRFSVSSGLGRKYE